jgi:hypothetical protein
MAPCLVRPRESVPSEPCTLVQGLAWYPSCLFGDGAASGAFASSSWTRMGKYYGQPDCFVFTAKPHVALYKGTTVNDHYQYFNSGTETLPNGLVREPVCLSVCLFVCL